MKHVILAISFLLVLAGSAQAAQLTLTWQDNSPDETGFEVERCQGAGCSSFTRIGAPGMNVSSYIDSTVTVGTTYCYRVRAVNSGGASGYSNSACATAPVPIPAAPTNLLVK